MTRTFALAAAGTLLLAAFLPFHIGDGSWTDRELSTIRQLWIGSLTPAPADPSNRYADQPAAASLGHKLFFDTRLSSNGRVSCATCHKPDRAFQDDLPLAVGVGVTARRTMPIAGTAHSPWMFWDGRKDSPWSQALGPLESPVEHGGSRVQYLHVVAAHYRDEYEALFGPLPDTRSLPPTGGPVDDPDARAAWNGLSEAVRDSVTRAFANLGKAIAAYERTLDPGPARFDRYAEAVTSGDPARARGVLSKEETAGLRLFIGKAQCINCHNGPLFSDYDFHNTGVPADPTLPTDLGRAAGAEQVLADSFNCLGPYSDARAEDCSELRFMLTGGEALVRSFKTPSLRGAADRAPYMHAGQIASLADVVEHYNAAPEAPDGHSELRPLKLSKRERRQVEAFLRTLDSPVVGPPGFLTDPFAFEAEQSTGP